MVELPASSSALPQAPLAEAGSLLALFLRSVWSGGAGETFSCMAPFPLDKPLGPARELGVGTLSSGSDTPALQPGTEGGRNGASVFLASSPGGISTLPESRGGGTRTWVPLAHPACEEPSAHEQKEALVSGSLLPEIELLQSSPGEVERCGQPAFPRMKP